WGVHSGAECRSGALLVPRARRVGGTASGVASSGDAARNDEAKGGSMTTLAIMKARIANELGQRTDLDSEIATAINAAIAAYQATRFHFNEGRTVTFTTVAGQEFYDADDAANLAKLWTIDYMVYYVGDTPY